MSRSLVGSSRTSMLAGWARARASSRRLRSPPDRVRDRLAQLGVGEQEVLGVGGHVLGHAAHHDAGRRRRGSGRRAGSCRRSARRGPGRGRPAPAWSPSLTEPASGASSPSSSLTRVVLPAPLGPTMAMRSPRRMRVVKGWQDDPLAERLGDALGTRPPACRTGRRNPTSRFSSPGLVAAGARTRSARMARSWRARPSLRVRRAVMAR